MWWFTGYFIIASATSGIYLGMATVGGKEAKTSALIAAGALWPFFLPFAIGTLIVGVLP